MKPLEFIVANAKYLADTWSGSFVDTIGSRQPELKDDEIIADLHAHPYISSINDLENTLDVLVQNNVSLLALTVHGKGDSRQFDFWKVKELIERNGLAGRLNYKDYEDSFEVECQRRKLAFIPGYEIYVKVPGVRGGLDIISLMPEKAFRESIKEGLMLDDYLKINHDFDAIVIAAHPYTIWDPYGPGGFFKFRLASFEERMIITESVFPQVDCVDLVATNSAWMLRSNELLLQDYHGKPLANSDAHSTSQYTRLEIGRAGNVMQQHNDSASLKDYLRETITTGSFKIYLNYTPPLQFLLSIVLDKPAENFP